MIYRRRMEPDGEDSLAKLARWIRPGATVLELGAAAGYFTQHLASLGCTVDVVEIDADAAREAQRFARRAIVADLAGDAWVATLGAMRYDFIVCADVLEHLHDGVALLARVRPLLADGGELLLSVPNVAHSALIARLVDERFEYGGEGLLDATHLRLYTWRSLAQALHDAGYCVLAWDATTHAGYDTEFRVSEQGLDPALRDVLVRRPHAFVYQWLVRAVPGQAAQPRVPGPTSAAASVPVRLLQADDEAQLTLERAASLPLGVGGASVALEWSLTRGTRAIRLLLADRPGVIAVHALALYAGDEVLWAYGGDAARLRHGDDVVPIDAARFALAADGAWIAPDAAPETIARADRLRATLAWPAGISEGGDHAVFAALTSALVGERKAAGVRRDELVAMIEARDAQLAVMYRDEATLKTQLADAQIALAGLEQGLAAERDEGERRERALHAQERIIDYRQSVRWWLQLPFVRARLAWRRVSGR